MSRWTRAIMAAHTIVMPPSAINTPFMAAVIPNTSRESRARK